jgi:uncharacterized linocin/CFP29 family protein
VNNANSVEWPAEVWQEIDQAVRTEVGKVRVAQKVLPTRAFDDNPLEVANDVINFEDLSVTEGLTKPFVEIYHEFRLTRTQVEREPNSKFCKTLARMAAKAISLGEDIVVFQGAAGELPADVVADSVASTNGGLLGEASPDDASDQDLRKVSVPIDVPRVDSPRPELLFGENVFSAVAEGVDKLVRKAQAPPYALWLSTEVHADTYVPPSDGSLVTTAERIRPLVEGGFYGTGTLPADRALLVALGGEPTSLYVGREATTEFVRQEGAQYFFRVVERVQFVARDPRALVLLKFAAD